MIDRLILFLRNAGLDITAEEVADILWLSGYLPSKRAEDFAPEAGHLPVEKPSNLSPVEKELGQSPASSPGPAGSALLERTPKMVLPLKPKGSAEIAGTPAISIASPAPPGLADKRGLIKALRPLTRKAPSKDRVEFDEIRTVRQIADQRIWQIFTRPALERQVEIDLVIEESPSMLFWSSVVDEFCHLVESTGVFRKVNFWSLNTSTPDSEPALYVRSRRAAPDSLRRRPAELANYSGHRLIF